MKKAFSLCQVCMGAGTLLLCGALVYKSVLAPVVDAEAAAMLHDLKQQKQQAQTIPGNFYDRNGIPLTQSHLEGEEGTLLYPETTSLLIGYNNQRFGASGLRKTCADTLYLRGEDVSLTLDIHLQEYAYSLLPEDACAIVLENTTGAILALASKSTVPFDANHLEESLAAANLEDGSLLVRGISEQDPPGSTMKILTTTAALEAERKSPGSITFLYDDNTPLVVPGRTMTIHNFDNENWGQLDLETAFTRSSNTYFANLVLQSGPDPLADLLERVGWGSPLPLDFCTLKSNIGDLSRPEELVQTSFGQGEVTITPLQLAATYAAYWNSDGAMMIPHLLSDTQPQVLCEAIASTSTLKTARSLLTAAAQKYGLTEETTRVTVGAKSGTAQCSGDRLHTWLVAGCDEGYTFLLSFSNGTSSAELYEPMKELISYTKALYPDGI